LISTGTPIHDVGAFVETLLNIVAPTITLLLLVAVGLDLQPSDFTRVQKRPGLVAVGVLTPPLILPMLAVALIAAFDPPPAAAGGLLLLVCCPAGGISNTYSYLARAAPALAVTLTATSCVLAVLTIPVASLMLERVWHQPLPYSVPIGLLVTQLVVLLGLPIGVGMFVRARWARQALRFQPLVRRTGFLLLAVLLTLALSGRLGAVRLDFGAAALLAVVFTVAAFVIGWLVALLLRAELPQRFTLAAEFATRNVSIATALGLSLAAQPDYVLFGGLYLTCEIPLLTVGAAAYRRWFADDLGRSDHAAPTASESSV
jgi:bile acid:Na+ symporter, BASS family